MGQKRYLEIGKITNVHGLAGEVKVYPWCDDAAFLCSFDVLYTDKNGKRHYVSFTADTKQEAQIAARSHIPSGGNLTLPYPSLTLRTGLAKECWLS